MTKVCSSCKIEKPLDAFQKRPERPIGVKPRCRDCQRADDAKKRTTEAGKRKYRKQLWKKAGINITYEEYKEKYLRLDGRCEICHTQLPSLCVDHNHETKEIRGLLCTSCNLGIENLKESTKVMANAIKYIEKYGGRDV